MLLVPGFVFPNSLCRPVIEASPSRRFSRSVCQVAAELISRLCHVSESSGESVVSSSPPQLSLPPPRQVSPISHFQPTARCFHARNRGRGNRCMCCVSQPLGSPFVRDGSRTPQPSRLTRLVHLLNPVLPPRCFGIPLFIPPFILSYSPVTISTSRQ
jgi:hypothetical protein